MIYLAADHRGFELKEKIKKWLDEWGYKYRDMGAYIYDEQDDYPDFVRKAAKAVAEDPKNNKAIVLGASGQGEAISANRYRTVRAAVFYGPSVCQDQEVLEKIIELSRRHNDANVLSLGAIFINEETSKEMIKLWLKTKFDGGRHLRRIKKLDIY